MKTENQEKEIVIRCGKTTDNIETLKELCEKEAEKLSETIRVTEHDTVPVPCWTEDAPELICVARFEIGNGGSIVYNLDFSETTL